MAAEFVACYEASNHGIWLRNFVTKLRVVDGIERPLKIYRDNNSAVLYSNNNKSSTKSKHIDIKFLVVKERVQEKTDYHRTYRNRIYASRSINQGIDP